ncbi:hypothetical protein A4A49_06262 [Nicotiana attenuata]|uniref:Uncharacterized protein n=1 Tax=Nicotiana attenuata TaxID=49451 RepID=A0A314LB59_NICAT|nr:hypothetical protein A4A49_06262 [Nicotiana attenuata]
MKILRRIADFKPEEETSIVPVWILIHQLQWHLFRWQVISKLVSDVGVAMAPGQATYSKFRGNVAKIKVEIELLKPRNKIRDERVKVQREEQNKQEKESRIEKKSNYEEGYQTVTRKRGSKDKKIANVQHKLVVTDQTKPQQIEVSKHNARSNKGITIREPTENVQLLVIEEAPGKGKGKIGESAMLQTSEAHVMQNDHSNDTPTNLVGSNNKRTMRGKKNNQETNKKKDGNKSQSGIEPTPKSKNQEGMDNEKSTEHRSEEGYHLKPGENLESLEVEDDYSEDSDHKDEDNSEASEYHASVESEEVNSDDHDDVLVETFCSQSLVDVAVTSAVDNVIDNCHLYPRGRSRGKGKSGGGRTSSRGRRGNKHKQKPGKASKGQASPNL